jgi:excisionase family DNA binding protein
MRRLRLTHPISEALVVEVSAEAFVRHRAKTLAEIANVEEKLRRYTERTGVQLLPVDVTKKKPVRREPARSHRHGQDVNFLHRLVDAKVVAEAMNCTTKHVYALVAAGQIPHSRNGRRIGFDLEEVKAWLDAKKIAVA